MNAENGITNKVKKDIMWRYFNDPERARLSRILFELYANNAPSYVLIDGVITPEYSDEFKHKVNAIESKLNDIKLFYNKMLTHE